MEYKGYIIKKEKWACGDYVAYDERYGEEMGFKDLDAAKFWVDSVCKEQFETRQEVVDRMWELGLLMERRGYDGTMNNKIWGLANDWNRKHENEEIFMCEHENDNGIVDGFYIEEDYLVFED